MTVKKCGRTLRMFSALEVQELIERGRTIIIYKDRILLCDAWLPYHPGGSLAIQHLVGRDASDEIDALHSIEAIKLMEKYQVGRVQLPWVSLVPPLHSTSRNIHNTPNLSKTFDKTLDKNRKKQNHPVHIDLISGKQLHIDCLEYPPLDSNVQVNIKEKYRMLRNKLESEGLFECNYWAYGREFARYLALLGLSLGFLHVKWYVTSAVFMGCFWHQLAFTAHDAGHMGITHNFYMDTLIGIFVADLCGGLSLGWWKHNHNVHHIVTNSPEHDPDIQHLPFFAVSSKFLESIYSSFYGCKLPYDAASKFFVRYQNYLYYIVLLFGRFNLYRLSLIYLIKGQGPRRGKARYFRHTEIMCQIIFYFWFGYLLCYRSILNMRSRVIYILVSHMITMPLHLQITLSHFAMGTGHITNGQESFPQRMLRTTMDVDCPEWLDFFHGGLQFQAIHHLYPRMPRHNLRRAQSLVKEFCTDVKIPYAYYGFVEGNRAVLSRLEQVARQASILSTYNKST